jgi:DNA-binding LacI/PurR family transcriptional regulator
MGNLAVNTVVEGIKAGLEKRDWSISRHKMTPELVIRDSTKAVPTAATND